MKGYTRKKTFHGEDVPSSPPQDALFHVIPIPFEKTTSYGKGTALGPYAILDASYQLELFDGKSIPSEKGIYTMSPVDCSKDIEEAFNNIEKAVMRCLHYKKIPVVLGGEHSITYPAFTIAQLIYNTMGMIVRAQKSYEHRYL